MIQRHHALSHLTNDWDSRKLFVATTNNTSASGASFGMLVSLVGVGILGIGGTDWGTDRTSNSGDQRGNLSRCEENGLIKNYFTSSIVKEL